MTAQQPAVVRREDYQSYPFDVLHTRLAFDIQDGETTVQSELTIERRGTPGCPLVLHGADVQLQSIAIDDRPLGGNEYAIDGETLTVFDVPDECHVQVVTSILPEKAAGLVVGWPHHEQFRSGQNRKWRTHS